MRNVIAHRRVITLPDRGPTSHPLQLMGPSGRSIDRVSRMHYLPPRRPAAADPTPTS